MKSTTRNILAVLTLLCSVVTLVLVALAFIRRHQEELECGEFDDLMDDDYITSHLDEQQLAQEADFAAEEEPSDAEETPDFQQEASLEETLAQEEE